MLFSCLRILTICTVFVFKKTLSSTQYEFLFLAFVLSHYFLAIIYSRVQILSIIKDKALSLRFCALSGIGMFMFFFNLPSAEVYFGLHHAISEAYTPGTYYTAKPTIKGTYFTTLRFILNAAIAAFILSTSEFLPVSFLPYFRLLICLATLGCFLFFLINARSLLKENAGIDLIFFEILGAIPFIAIKNCSIGYEDMGMYHITFWFFFPIIKNWKSVPLRASNYALASIGTTLALFLLTPAAAIWASAPWASWNHWVQNLAYLHFTASFALSRANPRWLVKLLQAAPS